MQSEYNCHVNTTLSVNEINRVNKIQSRKEKRKSLWLKRDSSLKAIDINRREKKGTRLRQNSFTIFSSGGNTTSPCFTPPSTQPHPF